MVASGGFQPRVKPKLAKKTKKAAIGPAIDLRQIRAQFTRLRLRASAYKGGDAPRPDRCAVKLFEMAR
jgi:hypothetical protein